MAVTAKFRYHRFVKTAHPSLETGHQALQNGDYAKAVNELLPLARNGNTSAQYYFGLMCHQGLGVPEDNTAAVRWASKAAAQGNADAAALLGVLYAQGQGVPKDDAEAARWFHKAAARGNASGQSKMGMCCMRGIGVAQDYLRAYMWFDLAASHSAGHEQQCNLNLRDTFAAMNLTPEQIAEAQRLARAWKPQKPTLLQRFHLA